MQAKPTKSSRVTIPIKVTTKDNPETGTRRGTFLAPWPKVLVNRDDLVRWRNMNGHTFTLTFTPCEGTRARSPFKKARITEKDDFLPVVNEGHFHYKVRVLHLSTGKKWEIRHCPEFQVGN